MVAILIWVSRNGLPEKAIREPRYKDDKAECHADIQRKLTGGRRNSKYKSPEVDQRSQSDWRGVKIKSNRNKVKEVMVARSCRTP